MTMAITAAGVTKLYGSRAALDDVGIEVPEGSVFGLIGPNGAGKTTLLSCVLGLVRPDRGTMSVLGDTLPEGLPSALSRTGALIEEPRFHGFLTGRENLLAVARLRGTDAVARVGPVLERVGLGERGDDRVGEYSLGMRQRLGLGRALLADPALLVLDEPTNGLDPDGIRHTRDLLREFRAEGRTVLVSSHQLGELEKVCDHVALMDAGKVVHRGAVGAAAAGTAGAAPATFLVSCARPDDAAAVVQALDDVGPARASGDTLEVDLADASEQARARVLRAIVDAGIDVHGAQLRAGESLEELYLRLRGGASA